MIKQIAENTVLAEDGWFWVIWEDGSGYFGRIDTNPKVIAAEFDKATREYKIRRPYHPFPGYTQYDDWDDMRLWVERLVADYEKRSSKTEN